MPVAKPGRSGVENLDVNAAEMQEMGVVVSDPRAAVVMAPMTVEIKAVLATATEAVADLQRQFEETSDDSRGLELVRQIESLKIEAELDVMRVQLKYAQLEGRDDLARELTAELAEMTTPRPRRQPVERPASSAGTR